MAGRAALRRVLSLSAQSAAAAGPSSRVFGGAAAAQRGHAAGLWHGAASAAAASQWRQFVGAATRSAAPSGFCASAAAAAAAPTRAVARGFAASATPLRAAAYSTAAASTAAPFSHALVTSAAAQRAVGAWLFGGAAWVFSMVVLGGVTRLTRSGLSMTDWKFTGEAAPRTPADWDAEFAKYRASPEFQKVNRRMTVEEFKFIFWMEYAHRMWGRVLGLYFALPVAYFAARGYLTGALGRRLGLLFAAGGSQGLVGWWMVKSGLEQPREHEVPRVSPYRLAAHLSTAFAIYAGILWTAMSVAWPTPPLAAEGLSAERVARALALRARAHPLAGLIALTAASGAFVAGLDAGHAYNTFPLMGGRVVPDEYWDPSLPAWRNALENTAAVQFHHRVLALSTLGAVGGTWAGAFAASAAPLPAAVATATHALFAAAAGQVTLGIATLLSCVPVWLGAAHQAGALTLFSVALGLLHTLRAPPSVKAKARAAAVQAAAKLA